MCILDFQNVAVGLEIACNPVTRKKFSIKKTYIIFTIPLFGGMCQTLDATLGSGERTTVRDNGEPRRRVDLGLHLSDIWNTQRRRPIESPKQLEQLLILINNTTLFCVRQPLYIYTSKLISVVCRCCKQILNNIKRLFVK